MNRLKSRGLLQLAAINVAMNEGHPKPGHAVKSVVGANLRLLDELCRIGNVWRGEFAC